MAEIKGCGDARGVYERCLDSTLKIADFPASKVLSCSYRSRQLHGFSIRNTNHGRRRWIDQHDLRPLEAIFFAGAGEDFYIFPADVELVYVLAGQLELRVQEARYLVASGDTVTYSPRDPHTWRNPSEEEEAVVLWFSVPNPYSSPRED